MNCNHPVVRDLLITCLRYWVGDMHIDGFRFDLASILGRDRNGHVLDEPSVIETIAEDGVLARAKLIAEPWDAAGLYQVGRFPFGKRWSEWNGQFRDDVRRFWRGDLGMSRTLAFRICGSPDLYAVADRLPCHSVNFVTCHDGFTLHDLVSYNTKHNEMNGEGNRDGAANEFSWNCGVEGETEDALVLGLRRRQAKNLMATLMLSQGVPMILAGDEFLRTQQGNNNAWCQDNEISWIDWSLKETNADFFRFVKEMIALRKRHPALRRRNWFRDLWMTAPFPEEHRDYRVDEVTPFEMRFTKPPEIIWHGLDPFRPDFSWVARTLAFAIDGRQTGREMDSDFYVALNAWMDPLPFRVPPSPSGRPWRRVVDTALASPLDIVDEMSAPPVPFDMRYLVAPYATVVLISQS
jgi:glycogen operon protein